MHCALKYFSFTEYDIKLGQERAVEGHCRKQIAGLSCLSAVLLLVFAPTPESPVKVCRDIYLMVYSQAQSIRLFSYSQR